jgi:hypothetical protein
VPDPLYFRDFSKGVVANLPPTKLVDTASPRAWNTAFRPVPGGTLTVSSRPGVREVGYLGNDSYVIAGQAFYHHTEDNATTVHHIVLTTSGLLFEIDSSGTHPITIPGGAHEFPGELGPAPVGVVFVETKNSLFGFIRNGSNFKIWRRPTNSTLYVGTIGLPTPDPVTFQGTASGNCTGDIDFRVAWYNSSTDTESPMSEIYTRSATNEAITVNLPAGAPTEVDKFRIYVRNQGLQTVFARNSDMEIPVESTDFTLDLTDAQFNQLNLTGSPTETAYQGPPDKQLCACLHLARIFVSDGFSIRYSRPSNPEYFDIDSEEVAAEGQGQLILGLMSLNEDLLGVFKERSIQAMSGQTPAEWSWAQLVPDVGCISTRSLCRGDDAIGFWSQRGPCAWSLGSPPEVLTEQILEGRIKDQVVAKARRDQTLGIYDPQGRRLLWRLDLLHPEDPWSVVAWSTVHHVWESLGWDLGAGITSLAVGESDAYENRVFIGHQKGVIYELSNTLRRDAASEVSVNAWTTVNGGSTTQVRLADPAFVPTTNSRGSVARLIDIKTLQVYRSTYTLAGDILTWTTAAPFGPAAGSLLVFDAPVAEWDTVDTVVGAPSYEKRILQTYAELWTVGDTEMLLGLFRNSEPAPQVVWSTTIGKNATDRPRQGPVLTSAVRTHKRWAGRLAQWGRLRFVGWYPLCDWGLTLLGMTTVMHDDED